MKQSQVQAIAAMAQLPLSAAEAKVLSTQFKETLAVIAQLETAPTKGVAPTYQLTGEYNRWREDLVRPELSFNQAEALSNAPRAHQGYFVVPRILKSKP